MISIKNKIFVVALIFIYSPCSFAQVNCVTPPVSMISWWTADSNSVDTQNNLNGTLMSGTTYGMGKVQKAFRFDGIDDLVLISDTSILDITGDITIDLWAKRTGFGSFANTIISKGGGGIPQNVPTTYLLRFINDQLVFLFEEETTLIHEDLWGPYVLDSNYHFYAYVRDGNFHSLMVDGLIVAQGSFNSIPSSSAGFPLTIGAQLHNPNSTGYPYDNFFEGEIDEIEIFNRALSHNELLQIFNAGPDGKCKNFVSTEELDFSKNNIKIFPNPSFNKFHIQLDDKIFQNYSNIHLIIYNVLGEQIRRVNISNLNISEFELTNDQSGCHYFTVIGDEEILKRGKLIKL
ncbi:MAG: LamG domain-containing protein [Bacteroidia bacterium]|nr:LamG domain-containing protein [Bacteroidia bacterium]